MSPLEEKAVARLRALPLIKQQQVLDFIEFLHARWATPPASISADDSKGISFTDAAAKYAGCLDDGPEDLSTNPAYMEGFGE